MLDCGAGRASATSAGWRPLTAAPEVMPKTGVMAAAIRRAMMRRLVLRAGPSDE